MNTENVKSFVSYRYEKIAWLAVRPAIMGYQAPNPISGTYFNYDGNVQQLTNVSGKCTNTKNG